MNLTDGPLNTMYWIGHNALRRACWSLHAGFIIVRGWRDDLIESRRGRRFARRAHSGLIEMTLVGQIAGSPHRSRRLRGCTSSRSLGVRR